MSISVLQPKFLRAFTAKIGLDLRGLGLGDPDDRSNWPAYREMLAERFAARTRDEWMADFDGDDDCVMAVLDLEEAPRHPHNVARGTFVDVEGTSQPAPAPRFSRTPSEIVRRPPYPGEGGDEALAEWGFAASEVAALRACRAPWARPAGLDRPAGRSLEQLLDPQRSHRRRRGSRHVGTGHAVLDRSQDRGDDTQCVALRLGRRVVEYRLPQLLFECVDGPLHLAQVMAALVAIHADGVGVGDGRIEPPFRRRPDHHVEQRAEPPLQLLVAGRLVVGQTSTGHLAHGAIEHRRAVGLEEHRDIEIGGHEHRS